jgi:hypothetical protein
MGIKANWARVVVAIFTMAVFYGSVCSATCAIGFCPNQVQQTAGHDCDDTSSHPSHQSGRNTPDKPDCSQHQHPGLFVTKSGDFSQFQLSVTSHPEVSAAAFPAVSPLIEASVQAEASDHAPPVVSSLPLYQQISVLRV